MPACAPHCLVYNIDTNKYQYCATSVQLQKEANSADDDQEGMTQLSLKLTKYNVSISEYAATIKDTDVPW